MRSKIVPLLVVPAAAIGIAACGDSESSGGGQAAAPKTDAPQVSITSPGDGQALGSTVTAKVDLEGFKLDPAHVGKDPKAGTGHLHFALDGGKFDHPRYSGANGKLAQQLGVDGKYSPAVAPEVTYRNLPAGSHTLKVMLANNDHSNTGQAATVTFRVKGDAGAAAKAGKNGERVAFESVTPRRGGLTATVSTEMFKVDAKQVGKAVRANVGHLHFQLDGGKFDRAKFSGANGKLAEQLGVDGKYSPAVMPTITYRNVPKGEHVLKVFLANNDHSDTGAVATRKVVVK